ATPPAACDTCWPTPRRVLVPTSSSSSTWPWRQLTGDWTAASGNRRRRHIVVAVALGGVEPRPPAGPPRPHRRPPLPGVSEGAGQGEVVGEVGSSKYDFPAPGSTSQSPHPPKGGTPTPGRASEREIHDRAARAVCQPRL